VQNGEESMSAYMALVINNAQGELSPLEYGAHALGLENRRGKKGGGMAEYAEAIGRDAGTVTRARQAAEVFVAVKNELP